MPRRASSLRSRVSRFVFAVLLLTLACAGAAKADTFQNGQFVTYDSGAWVFPISGPGATLLVTDYTSVYASTANLLTVGLPSAGFTMSFDRATKVFGYLPAGGAPGALTGNSLDPTLTSAGIFGGDVLALQLNVDFNNAGFLKGTSSISFGNLVLTNLNSAVSGLDGLTVTQFLADANTCLGGGSCIYSPANLDGIAAALNLAFDGGVVSSFAQASLALPGSVTPTPEPSSLLMLGAGLVGLGVFQHKRRRDANSIAV